MKSAIMAYTMKSAIMNKITGEVIKLPDSAYETEDVYIIPVQCFDKKDYEIAYGRVSKKKEKV